MATAKPPKGLGAEGRRVWRKVISDAKSQGLVLDSREELWLENAAHIADRIDELEAELAAGSSFVVPGHAGQPTASPLLTEVRMHRALLATTLGRLRVDAPEASGGIPTAGINRHRGAALSRWYGR